MSSFSDLAIVVCVHLILLKHVYTLNPNGKNVCKVRYRQSYMGRRTVWGTYIHRSVVGSVVKYSIRTGTYPEQIKLYRTAYKIACCDGYISDTSDDGCIHRCSSHPDSNTCYPGFCTSTPDTCICDEEFNEANNCMKITLPPMQKKCSISLQRNDVFSTITCKLSLEPAYTNIGTNVISVTFQTQFSGPSKEEYPIPKYVSQFEVGITSSVVHWVLERGNTVNDSLIDYIHIESGDIDCGKTINRDYPKLGLHSCLENLNLGSQLQNGDRLFITFSSTNGGNLKLRGLKSPDVRYYEGKTLTMDVRVIFDFEPPVHCSVSLSRNPLCLGNMLDIGEPFSRSLELKIYWSPWVDYISGLLHHIPYECRVYKLTTNINGVLYADKLPDRLNYTRIGDKYRAVMILKLPGVYCVVLAVKDAAGNIRNARRCFIFDDISEIEVVDHSPLVLEIGGNKRYNNSVVMATEDQNVTFSWYGHFVNQLHKDYMLLPINVGDEIINENYDSEAYPAGRPLSSIANKNGIVKFEFAVTQENAIRTKLSSSFQPQWNKLSNDLDEIVSIKLENDGDDTFRLWVRATDVVGNKRESFISVRIKRLSATEKIPVYVIVLVATRGIICLIPLSFFLHLLKKRKRRPKSKSSSNNNSFRDISTTDTIDNSGKEAVPSRKHIFPK